MVDDKTRELLAEGLFRSPDFENVWMECKNMYENLGFRDNISDEEMIAEYKYIAQQLRKYIFTKQGEILRHSTYDEMLQEVDNLIGKAPEYEVTRPGIVYNFIRDHWLYDIRNVFVNLMNAEEGEDE